MILQPVFLHRELIGGSIPENSGFGDKVALMRVAPMDAHDAPKATINPADFIKDGVQAAGCFGVV